MTELDFASRTHVMGILNVTPDSFSDGGRYDRMETAVARALEMVEEGVDIIDIGGESTRPGSKPILAKDERARVLPVIREIRKRSDVILSLDTRKSDVAGAGLEEGIDWINDVSGGEYDPQMLEVVAAAEVPYVIMHMRESPETMQQHCDYENVVEEVSGYLLERCRLLRSRGIQHIIVDPGLGFAKTAEQNVALLQGLTSLKVCDAPILVGASRKSFIQKMLDHSHDGLLEGSLAVAAFAILQGCHLLRVHDVAATVRLSRVLDQLRPYTTLSS